MNIVLIGFMGTGKSAIGKKLAQRLSMGYLDTDEIIEEGEGCRIFQIFQERGEKYFRKIEAQVVKEVARQDNYVIATGGGVALSEENMAVLRKNSLIICLSADPETIWRRTANNCQRPLLNCKDQRKKIKELLKAREPYYQRADFIIDTSRPGDEGAVERIREYCQRIVSHAP